LINHKTVQSYEARSGKVSWDVGYAMVQLLHFLRWHLASFCGNRAIKTKRKLQKKINLWPANA